MSTILDLCHTKIRVLASSAAQARTLGGIAIFGAFNKPVAPKSISLH